MVMVIAALLVGAVDAALLVRPSSPPLPTVGWWPADGFPSGPRFDPSQVQTMTVVPIAVDWLECFTPRHAELTVSMLATPEVSYTRTSVIITMRFNDPSGVLNNCVSPSTGASHYDIVLDVGLPVEVHLDSPLRGRTLLDGSTDPPQPPVQY